MKDTVKDEHPFMKHEFLKFKSVNQLDNLECCKLQVEVFRSFLLFEDLNQECDETWPN